MCKIVFQQKKEENKDIITQYKAKIEEELEATCKDVLVSESVSTYIHTFSKTHSNAGPS